MFSKFLSRVGSLPARSSDWASRVGPVALFGYDRNTTLSSKKLLDHFYTSPRDCDYYAELTFHDEAPVECPPESVMFLPVLKCGTMTETEDAENWSDRRTPNDGWLRACSETASELTEKGYIPVSVGGDGSATSCMVEGYKRLYPDDNVVVIHFSARPSLDQETAPLRMLLEKKMLKGVVSVGNRCVSAADRRIRKEHQTFYMDMHAIYSKGLFCIRDIRNDYPVLISINADVLDPSCAPGVIDPVAGGLSTRELLHIISGIRGPKVIGVDLHGYHPELDIYRNDSVGLSQIALSKVLKETILKAYTISTVTEEEGLERVKMMQRQGTLSKNPYPDY
eukprot:gene6478-4665_t